MWLFLGVLCVTVQSLIKFHVIIFTFYFGVLTPKTSLRLRPCLAAYTLCLKKRGVEFLRGCCFQQWKNFQNRLAFDEVIAEIRHHVFEAQCTYCTVDRQRVRCTNDVNNLLQDQTELDDERLGVIDNRSLESIVSATDAE